MTTNSEIAENIPSQHTTNVDKDDIRQGTVHERCKNIVKNNRRIITFLVAGLISITVVTVIILNPFFVNHTNNEGKCFLITIFYQFVPHFIFKTHHTADFMTGNPY